MYKRVIRIVPGGKTHERRKHMAAKKGKRKTKGLKKVKKLEKTLPLAKK